MSGTTWRALLSEEMQKHGDSLADMVSVYPADLDLDREFDDGFGTAEGVPFFLWTFERVYFPVVYDGAEWAKSVPRNPVSNEEPEHLGGQ